MKLKFLLSISIFVFVCNSVSAQNENIGKIEFEIGAGIAYPTIADGIPAVTGFQFVGEVRYNLKPSFDMGIQYFFNKFYRDDVFKGESHTIRNHTISAFIDYNWRPQGI